jgi:capsular exopolysaccharide synthesis family protein
MPVDVNAGTSAGFDSGNQDEFPLLAYWRTLKRYKWSLVALAIIAGAVGTLAAMKAVPLYRAETRILVKYNQPNLANVQQFESTPLYWYFYETQIDIIRSRSVAARVVDKLGLDTSVPSAAAQDESSNNESAAPGVVHGWTSELASWVRSWKQLLPPVWRAPEKPNIAPQSPRDAAINAIIGGLQVTGGRESEVLQIRYVSTDPNLAAQVANAVAQAYIAFGLESRSSNVQQATGFLRQRIDELKLKLEKSEQALQEFQQAEGLVDTQNREKIVGAQLGSLTAELIKAQTARSQAEARYNQVKSYVANRSDYESLVTVIGNPLVLDAHRARVEMERRVSELGERYGEKHPRMRAALADSKQAEFRLRSEVEKAVDTVRKEFEVAKAQERELKNIIDAQQAEMRTLSGKAFTLAKFEREVEANRQLYESFVARFKEADIADEYDVSNVRIIDEAKVPAGSFKPNRQRMVFISVLIGLLLGVFLAIVRSRLDNTVNTREDVENRLGLPLLGMLQSVRVRRRKGQTLEQYVLTDPRTPFSEAVNDIRTAILYSDVDDPPHVVLLTSSIAQEGKTALACNLALAFGKRGRTLLLDADLRRGRLAKAFGLKADRPGVTDVVLGECALEDTILAHPKAENLFLLCAGTVPPNPLEVVSSRKFARAMEDLRTRFDYIVIDGAPVLPVSDSVVLGHLVDAVVFTVQSQQTTFKTVEEALRRLASGRIRPAGVVLQQVDLGALESYSSGYRGLYRSYSTYQYQQQPSS